MPIQDLGPSDVGGRGLERAQDTLEASRSKRERAADGTGDAAGTELHRAESSESVSSGAHSASTAGTASGDRVELSLAAQALSAGEDPKLAAQRTAQITAMKDSLAAGTLVNPERIARAAQRLLGS
jgi:hypothetical protein